MKDQETKAQLEGLSQEHPDFKTFPGKTRILVGLQKLETHTSRFVGAWIDDLPQKVLNDLIRTNLFDLILDATEFVSSQMDNQSEPRFVNAWRKFESLVGALERKGANERPELFFVGMFFAAVVLRNYFELLSVRKDRSDSIVQIDEKRLSPVFVSLVISKAKTLPISFDIQGPVAQKIDELPLYLDELMKRA